MRSKKTFLFLGVLLLIDMLSTWWLHNHVDGVELNPVIRVLLGNAALFFAGKTLLSCVVLGAMYVLRSQSVRVFKWSSVAVCAVFLIACINNVLGMVVMACA